MPTSFRLNHNSVCFPPWCGSLGQVWMCQSHSGAQQKQTKQTYREILEEVVSVHFPVNSGVVCLWWECDLTSIRPSCWRTAHFWTKSAAVDYRWLFLTPGLFIVILLHVNSDQSKGSLGKMFQGTSGQSVVWMFSHDSRCCILVCFTNSFTDSDQNKQCGVNRSQNGWKMQQHNYFFCPRPGTNEANYLKAALVFEGRSRQRGVQSLSFTLLWPSAQ